MILFPLWWLHSVHIVAEFTQDLVHSVYMEAVVRDIEGLSEAGIAIFFSGPSEVLTLDAGGSAGAGELDVDVLNRLVDIGCAVLQAVVYHSFVDTIKVYI